MAWRESIDIKQHLDLNSPQLDDNAEVPKAMLEGVRAEIQKSRFLPVKDLLLALDEVTCIAEFDEWLATVYDYGDARRVWLGL